MTTTNETGDAPGRKTPASQPDHTANADGPIRVMIADDHRVLREGLVSLLRDEPDIQVIGQASDGQMAVELARDLNPDVIIMDISMPRLDGIEATRRIMSEREDIGIVGLSMHMSEDMARAMLDAGATAYVTKGSPTAELIVAIRQANRSQ